MDFQYKESLDGILITDCRGDSEVSIPTEINGRPVSSVAAGEGSFQGMTSLTIPSGISFDFIKHETLERVTIVCNPNDTAIQGTFEFCQSLRSITIKEGVTSVGPAFAQYCKNLEEVKFPFSLREIGGEAFLNCESLQPPALMSNLKEIGARAFHGCRSMTIFMVPDSVEVLGEWSLPLGENDHTGSGNSWSVTIFCKQGSPADQFVQHENDMYDTNRNIMYSGDKNNIGSEPSDERKDGCYIATAVYGSYDCSQVWVLRRFRDYRLKSNHFGRAFVSLYYAISPSLAGKLKSDGVVTRIARGLLDRLVNSLEKRGYSNSPYSDRR